ncbi:methyltransferase [Planctomycetia bacterium]|nr:methyltransferase [Planctomycetia bacterium]
MSSAELPLSLTDPEAFEAQQLLELHSQPALLQLLSQCSPAELRNQKRLRQQFDEQLVPAAIALHEARQRAVGKLPQPERLWLSRTGLEQATAWDIARHKAHRFAGCEHVFDLCCGIGMDAAALTHVAPVTAVDQSQAMVLRTTWNHEILGGPHALQTQCQDVRGRDWTGTFVHADPDRRDGRERPTKRLEQYLPDLSWMQQLVGSARGGAIKISPASNFQQKFPGCEIELISLHGECREATVWFGELSGSCSFSATCLETRETLSADPLSAWAGTAASSGRYLFDPDPGIVRAGLIDVLAEQHSLLRMDAEEEYLTGDSLPDTGFLAAFEVEAVLGSNVKELKAYLRGAPRSEYEIKCRRVRVEADALRRTLPRGDGPAAAIIVCRVGGRVQHVVARRIPRTAVRQNPGDGIPATEK